MQYQRRGKGLSASFIMIMFSKSMSYIYISVVPRLLDIPSLQ
jgi:hypothetical protein